MATMHTLFKSKISSCNYITKAGKPIYFNAGRFSTANAVDIAELKELVADGHPSIFIDPNENEIDFDIKDPLDFIKKKAVEEYLKAQKDAMNPNADRGTTVSEKLKGIANTKNIADATAGSASQT